MDTSATPGVTEPLLTFQVITDTHVTADPEHEYNQNFRRALEDLALHAQGSSGIMHIGDITDHGFPNEYEEVQRILEQHQASLPQLRYTLGNHDVGLGHWESRLAMYTSRMGMPGPYHDHWIGGYHFIFLGTEEGLPTFCNLSAEQLQWLDRKLGERAPDKPEANSHLQPHTEQASLPDQPVFLFLHQPLKDTVAGSLESQEWYGVTQDQELRTILSRHPQTLLFTGHTHWELEVGNTMYPGNGQTATMFNAASVAYLWTDADEHKNGSQGYYIEVYADKVLVRGRDFTTGTWIEAAQYEVAYPVSALR
ncbi:metallophosphoesterase [Paenibacillus sp. FSL R7-0337]|uniref:metallophosphoesterase family protein n=1 Tax=Paenibacillus sp. FSL R7-0337 TaxID=1926588 RepID=UPI00096DEDFD|nr:metallophosphoesterase [Paenibacillus sp. FSL R7-0337]OMF88302.1 metallophosphoesterase [Paenibacillus sp. FSL R7-0337]